jgi:hypothetical protein
VARVTVDRWRELGFSAGRAGVGPATWGQHKIWNVVRGLGDGAARFNVSGGCAVSPALPFERVTELVRELLLAHDSLRTKLFPAGQRRLDQVVHADGAVPVLVRQSEPDAIKVTAHALYHELQAMPFSVDEQWPVRLGVVEAGGLVRFVIFSLSHTAADGGGLRNLLAGFTALLAGGPIRTVGMTPLAEAEFQRSARGKRLDSAARRWWAAKLAQGPASMFPASAGQPKAATFPSAVLNSPALAIATEQVSASLKVSPASVLLAGAAAALHRLTGVRDALFQVVVSNRFLPGLADGVNIVAQEGLFWLPGADKEFAGLIRQAFGATLSAHRHAYYDKLALDDDLAQARQRGPVADFSCLINDTRGMMPIRDFARPAAEPLAQARARTTLTWPAEFDPRDTTFAMGVRDAQGSMELAITTDSATFPKPEVEKFLFGIEDLIVGQAEADGVAVVRAK